MPVGTFGIWNIYMLVLLIAIIFGEVKKPAIVSKYTRFFPLLQSR